MPTDNLYKFIAIFGITLIGLSFVLQYKVSTPVLNQTVEISEKIEILSENSAIIQDDLKNIKDKVEKIEEKIDSPLTSSRIDEVNSDLEVLNNLDKKLRLNLATLRGKQIALHVLEQRLKIYQRLSLSGFIIGFFMIFFGFYLWYWKLQRHLDKALEKKLNLSSLSDENSQDDSFDVSSKE